GRDSNPRYPFRYGRFRGGSFQPLTHLSVFFWCAPRHGAGRESRLVPAWSTGARIKLSQALRLFCPLIGGPFDLAPFGAFARDFACGLPLRSRPQSGSSFGGIGKTMSRLPSTDPPEPRVLPPSGG